MQTFLPLPGYMRSARALDNKRLGKQRVECKQIARALGVPVGGSTGAMGWRHHPAVQMWRGYEYSLLCYAIAVCHEWRSRGFRDSLLDQFLESAADAYSADKCQRPPFVGNDRFHASHRSNLLRKDPAHYGQLGWAEPDSLPYVWPSQEDDA
jgi:hypothetical protein